jgi:hypothetical protein
MAVTHFIGEQALKDNSVLNENVDMKLITPIITLVQDKYVIQTLGTGQYNEVKSAIIADTTLASNSRIKTLVDDYIQPMMIWWILYELQPVLNYKLTNKSIAQKSSDNSQPAGRTDMLGLMDRHKDNAQYYTQRLINYLIANPTLFPLYFNPGNTVDTVVPRRRPYTKGLYLGPRKNSFIDSLEHVRNNPRLNDDY